jgi:drug/metabolite transporter (DMT)-like permease
MLRLLTLSLIWGWSFLFIKVAGEGIPPATIAWARIALGALALWAFVRQQGLRVPGDRVMIRHFAVVAVAGNVLPFTLLAWAEQHITSALTSVLNASTPLFTALVAALALSERLRPVQLVGLATGVVGVAVAAGFGAADLSGSSALASLAAASAGAGYGVAFVYMRRHLTGVAGLPPLVAATGQLTTGAVLMLPVAVGATAVGGLDLTPSRVASIVLLGAMGTGVAYVLSYGVIADLGPTKASLVTYLIPFVAVVVGIAVLDEPFEWRIVVGGLVTVAGIAAVNRRPPADESPGAPGDPGVQPNPRSSGALRSRMASISSWLRPARGT